MTNNIAGANRQYDQLYLIKEDHKNENFECRKDKSFFKLKQHI